MILTAAELERTERPETATHAWCYVATVPGRLKIGISLDPDRRRRQLETAIGQRLLDWSQYWLYAPGAAERFLLNSLSWARLQGEWVADPGGLLGEYLRGYLAARQSKRH